jgi:hypothetical protein
MVAIFLYYGGQSLTSVACIQHASFDKLLANQRLVKIKMMKSLK